MRLHVLTVLRHAGRAGPQKFIAPGSPVSTNNFDLRAWVPHRRGHIGQNIEDPGIIMLHVAGAVIAQEMVELLFRFGKINIAAPVHNINVLSNTVP